MSPVSLKKLIPILILIILLYVIYVELKNNILQIKIESVNNQPEVVSNNGLGSNSYAEVDDFDMSYINKLKKLVREEERKKFKVYWKAIERKDSYNNELQFYSKDNVVIKEDTIEIISKKEVKESKMYTSGLVESTNAYKYGYFEFVIEISEGNGIFPAIWFMPSEEVELPEIDLFEMIGSEPYTFYGVVHFKDDGIKDKDHFKYNAPKKEQYCVSLEWKTESLTWFIDNKEVYTSTRGVPQEYMYIIVNQAVGGDWPGNPDDTIFPSKFKVVSSRIEPKLKKGRN